MSEKDHVEEELKSAATVKCGNLTLWDTTAPAGVITCYDCLFSAVLLTDSSSAHILALILISAKSQRAAFF